MKFFYKAVALICRVGSGFGPQQ